MELYPPRAAEALSSWMILLWGLWVLRSGDILVGPQYQMMLRIMSEARWGWTAVIAAGLSLAALVWNGHGRPTPWLRMLGALYRFSFWLALLICYSNAVDHGAADFPMRLALAAPIMFEMYASIWIGRDMVVHTKKFDAFDAVRVSPRLAGRRGHG